MNDSLLRYNSGICLNYYFASLIVASSNAMMLYFGIESLVSKGKHNDVPVLSTSIAVVYLLCSIISGISVLLGVYGFLNSKKRKTMFMLCYIGTFISGLFHFSIGVYLWSKSLYIGSNYNYVWKNKMDDFSRSLFQSIGGCCGYLNSTDFVSLITPSCKNVSTGSAIGCIGPLYERLSKYFEPLK
ncbi:hypothetical protein BB560_000568 [Smittium megazygosporum]|uniref:Tetraspanin n=1 Tax=Smittium megazygosporum TaxID=133381 RepID=A0A2T9ZJY4_9FUNG|nr:hypothetical protein BB560_000568 [Smittium megazygosporum]